jgi:hypothetical protein
MKVESLKKKRSCIRSKDAKQKAIRREAIDFILNDRPAQKVSESSGVCE